MTSTRKRKYKEVGVGGDGVQLGDGARCIGEVSPVKHSCLTKKTVQMVSFEPKLRATVEKAWESGEE